jgi:hypothetical protein
MRFYFSRCRTARKANEAADRLKAIDFEWRSMKLKKVDM